MQVEAVELLIKYDLSPQSMINELGCPCGGSLYNRDEEYLGDDGDIPDADPDRRYGGGILSWFQGIWEWFTFLFS